MRRISATAASRGFADVLDRVEHRGETFVIERRGHEIAAVLGIPEGTVKSRMHHAVRLLRDELADLVEVES